MFNSELCVVIGSGPAGVACTKALVSGGCNVTVLDSGLTLEAERRAALSAISLLPKKDWAQNNLTMIKGNVRASESGIPLKLAYGSDYPYRKVPGATPIICNGPESMPSHALGGLSTVWGSAVMPYRQADIQDWPLTVQDLEPAYRAVLQWMPYSALEDDLATLFPLYRDAQSLQSLPLSRQATGLLAALEKNRTALNKEGVYFGKSRLAVRAADDPFGAPACVQCGLCMYGCPHGLIYSSDQTLAKLRERKQVDYRAGYTLKRITEVNGGVQLETVRPNGEIVELHADRVFLGAGLLNSTAVLLRSLEQHNTEVLIRDSQYFLMPLLRAKGTPDVLREPLHTLAQLFVEVLDESISPFTVHLQTYTYNDLFEQAAFSRLGALKAMFPAESFLGRLLLFQGYLHSAHSSPISVRLEKQSDGDALRLESSLNSDTKNRVQRLSSKFLRLAGKTGVAPVPPLLQIGKPGRGFHSGGTFPMRLTPKSLESDLLGRPYGLSRVHVIDASVLPSIPATTITLTVMANAYRIGAACGNAN